MTNTPHERLLWMIGLSVAFFMMVGWAALTPYIAHIQPLPTELADRCEPMTPAALRVNEKLRPSTPVNCPEGYMPIYR